MYNPNRRAERTVFAAAAALVAALGLSTLASAFMPADPHVGATRAHAVLDRATGIHDAAAAGTLRLASVKVLIR